ncbi:unnamed protein product [Boreogadus saida]
MHKDLNPRELVSQSFATSSKHELAASPQPHSKQAQRLRLCEKENRSVAVESGISHGPPTRWSGSSHVCNVTDLIGFPRLVSHTIASSGPFIRDDKPGPLGSSSPPTQGPAETQISPRLGIIPTGG